jgi:hypothetical protein
MEQQKFIVLSEDQWNTISLGIQKISYQQPVTEKLPENIGAEEAKKLLAEIWGCPPISDSWFYKKTMIGELPSAKAGKFLVFNRMELIRYAESRIKKPSDPVSDALQRSADKKNFMMTS